MSKREILILNLQEHGFKDAELIYWILWDTFKNRNGFLEADVVVAAGLCKEGYFKAWRQKLIDYGFVKYDEEKAKKKKVYWKHSPGEQLKGIFK